MASSLTESEFETLADRTLQHLVDRLADLEADEFEADLASGVLKIDFEDGPTFVVNSHRAAKQIWMAAGASAWHFDYADGHWTSSKSDEDLWTLVEQRVGQQLGRAVSLRDG